MKLPVLRASAMVLPLLTASILTTHAQERAAAGAAETQMTWSSLKSSIDTARAESKAAHARIDLIEKCNKKKMIHAPSVTGADDDGCVDVGGGQTVRVFGGTAGGSVVERNIGKWKACYISRYGTTDDNHHCDVRQSGQKNFQERESGPNVFDYTPSETKDWIMFYQQTRCAVTCVK